MNTKKNAMRKQTINNPRYPHHVKVMRRTYPDQEWMSGESSEPTNTVLYSGNGRCFTNGTVNEKQVDISHRYISIPVNVNEWGTLHPASGDIVEVMMGEVIETMEVKDFEPDNNRTLLYCERNGNLDQ